jgi:resuscitation-promoting factor RpfB
MTDSSPEEAMKRILTTAALSVALLAGGTAPAVAETTATPDPSATATTTDLPRLVIHRLNTVHKVTLKVGAAKRKATKTRAATVADLLAMRGITLGASDTVKPGLTTDIRKGLKITVKRITVTSVTLTEVVAAPMAQQLNASLRRGLTTVLQAGVPGSADRTYVVTTVNGKVTNKVLTGETILVAPVSGLLSVGTKGKPLNLAHLKLWNKIARCESGGNWHINTGNGYYGGLQFALGTWRSYGGRDFAAKPHKASKAEQITVANRVYKKQGTRPWGCA